MKLKNKQNEPKDPNKRNLLAAFTDKVAIIGGKLGQNKILSAMRDAFMINVGLLVAASIPLIIAIVFFQNGGVIGGFDGTKDSSFYVWSNKYIAVPMWEFWGAAQGIFTIVFVVSMAYFMAKAYGQNEIITVGITLAVFWLFGPLKEGHNFLGTSGLLLSIPIAILTPWIYAKFMGIKKLQIKLPAQVPPVISKVFASIFAMVLTVLPFILIEQSFVWISDAASLKDVNGHAYSTFFVGIEEVLRKPFNAMSTNIGTTAVIALMISLFWFFGVHGTNIMNPITQVLWTPLIAENAIYWKKFSEGSHTNYWSDQINIGDATNIKLMNGLHVIPIQPMAYVGGTGATLALVILTLMFVRYKMHRELAKVSIAPGVFGINEPVNFGFPMILNFVYFIPFVFGFTALMTLSHVWVTLHLMRPAVLIPPMMPYGLDTFFATSFDWRALLFALGHLVVSFLFWLPFLKPGVKSSMLMNGEEYSEKEFSWSVVKPNFKKAKVGQDDSENKSE